MTRSRIVAVVLLVLIVAGGCRWPGKQHKRADGNPPWCRSAWVDSTKRECTPGR